MAEGILRGTRAGVLFTLQSEKQVINIPLIVACRFSDVGLHLNGIFIETAGESLIWLLAIYCLDVVVVVVVVIQTQGCPSTITPNSAFTRVM